MNYLARLAARLRPRSSMAAAQLAQQASAHFLPRCTWLRMLGQRAERCLVDVVERGQAAREEFAVDHPLAKPSMERKPSRNDRSFQAPGDKLSLLRETDHRFSANIHDPVGGGAVELAVL